MVISRQVGPSLFHVSSSIKRSELDHPMMDPSLSLLRLLYESLKLLIDAHLLADAGTTRLGIIESRDKRLKA
jgi:hypothetical protein